VAAEVHQSGTELVSQKVREPTAGSQARGVYNRQATAVGLYTVIGVCESSCNVFMYLMK
jgi:hypothetical protein